MKIAHPKLKSALNSLIMKNVFFSSVLLQHRFVECKDDPECPTACIDGETLKYNPSFIDTLSFQEICGLLAHESLHICLAHHARIGKRDFELWNIATDYAINSELKQKGFVLPKCALEFDGFKDTSAETIYRLLDQRNKSGSGNNNQSGQGNPQSGQNPQSTNQQSQKGPNKTNPSKNPSVPDASKEKNSNFGAVKKGKQTMTQAKQMVEVAKALGIMAGDKSANLEKIFKELQPKFQWQEIINKFVGDVCSSDYNWSKINKRYLSSGFILPGLAAKRISKFTLGVDVSGSIGLNEISVMVSEILNCLNCFQEEGIVDPKLEVIYIDTEIKKIETIELNGPPPSPVGGGGTDFRELFRYLDKEGFESDALIFMTDGMTGGWADKEPNFPVLWMRIGNYDFQPPFGERYDFDVFS